MQVFTNDYSFSGSDARARAFFPLAPENLIPLDSLQTISISVNEAKADVRALGYRNVKGRTKSLRLIAGTMIFVLMDDHPLRQLNLELGKILSGGEEDSGFELKPATSVLGGWSIDRDKIGVGTSLDIYNYNNRLATTLPPFNVVIDYVTELGNDVKVPSSLEAANRNAGLDGIVQAKGYARSTVSGVSQMLAGVEFINEGVVTSINDTYTEVTFTFKAYDYKSLASNNLPLLYINYESKAERDNRVIQERIQAEQELAMNRRKAANLSIPNDQGTLPPADLIKANANQVSVNAVNALLAEQV